MAAVTNLTNLTSAENFYEIVEYTNNTTGGILIIMFIISLSIIMFVMLLKRYEPEVALLSSAFFSMMFCFLLVAVNLLDFEFLMIYGVVFSIMVFYVYMLKR